MLNEFKNYLIETYHEKIHKIYLYGSYARGDNDEESDIDICIVFNDKKENIRKYRKEINDIQTDLSLKYEVLISLIIKTKEEVEHRKDILPFYKNIIREGVSLYG